MDELYAVIELNRINTELNNISIVFLERNSLFWSKNPFIFSIGNWVLTITYKPFQTERHDLMAIRAYFMRWLIRTTSLFAKSYVFYELLIRTNDLHLTPSLNLPVTGLVDKSYEWSHTN